MTIDTLFSNYPGAFSIGSIYPALGGLGIIAVGIGIILHKLDKRGTAILFPIVFFILTTLGWGTISYVDHLNRLEGWEKEFYIAARELEPTHISVVSLQVNNDGTLTALLDTPNIQKTITLASDNLVFVSDQNSYMGAIDISGLNAYNIPDQYIEPKLFINKDHTIITK